MTERLRSGNNLVNSANISAKMSNDLTPRKTMLILVIVVGCFAVLWPKVFYPMLVGSANQHIKPSPIDKTTGCCDVISETDINTIKIMSELCRTIIKKDEDLPLTGREIVAKCQSAVLETCGIDISAVLQEQVRLGQSVKQILDEVRSLNGSLCLKYNFGVAPWRLGVPHRVTVKMSPSNIRQERPLHLRSELVHPAFRERGRAIPQPQVTSSRTTTRVVEGRPGPIPGMRPTLGGAGHVVPPPKQSTGSMGLIMPIYTIGIVIFFTYTVLKIIFKKQPEALYPPVEPDPNFRREVFESERSHVAPKLTREGVSSKLVVNAMSALLDEVDQEIESRRVASEIAEQNVVANGNLAQEEEQPSVKVLGMETTASCEGGKKWSRPESPVLPASSLPPQEPPEPPQEIFLEGALPPQSQLLVADSATQAERTSSEEDPAVVLAGKMTLSVISLDSSENGTDESSNLDRKQTERSSSNVSEDFEKVEVDDQLGNLEPQDIVSSVQQSTDIQLLEQIQNEIKALGEKEIITNLESVMEPLELEEIQKYITEYDLAEDQEKGDSMEENNQQDLTAGIEEPNLNKSTVIVDQLIGSENSSEEKLTSDSEKDIATDDARISILEKDQEKGEIKLEAESEIKDSEPSGNEKLPSDSEKEITTDDAKISILEEDQEKGEIKLETEIEIQEKDSEPTGNVEQDLPSSPVNIDDQIAQEILTEDNIDTTGVELLSSNNASLVSSTISEPPISSNVSESISSSNISELLESNDISILSNAPEAGVQVQEAEDEKDKSQTVGSAPEQVESDKDISEKQVEILKTTLPLSTTEEESFKKLNEAISDLSSEFRSKDKERDEPVETIEEELDNDEEVEYEYEDSDNEVVEEEIRNVERLNNEAEDIEASGRVNGENQELSKYGTTSSVTLAENDISDEELLENEDDGEIIQEIIEYITDEEEEVEYIVEPVRTNETNHLHEQPNSQ